MPHRAVPFALEPLEERQLMSVEIILRRGVFTVIGTRRADTVTMSVNAADPAKLDIREQTRTTDHTTTINIADVHQLILYGYGGDNLLRFDPVRGDVSFGIAFYVGGGNNTIVGGAGPDNVLVLGGTGRNVIYGQGGGDLIYAGEGDDLIYGGDGHDRIYAYGGDDTTLGNSGGDAIYGGTGDDVIFGNSGVDYIEGNGGRDVLSGGSGADTVLSNPKNDITDGDTTDDNPVDFLD